MLMSFCTIFQFFFCNELRPQNIKLSECFQLYCQLYCQISFVQIVIRATDGGGRFSEVNLICDVNRNLNEPTFDTEEYAVTIQDNQALATNIIRVVASDADRMVKSISLLFVLQLIHISYSFVKLICLFNTYEHKHCHFPSYDSFSQ